MKYKDVIDLIQAHYMNEPQAFFNSTLTLIRELRLDGKEDLADHLEFIIKPHIIIRPKVTYKPDYKAEISFEEAEKLGWTFVPQGEPHE